MSFTPLPPQLTTDLAAAGRRPVLDLGTADGRLGLKLAGHAETVVGMDLSPVHGPDIVGDARRLPLRPGSIAVIVMGNLFRHLHDPAVVLDACRDALTPDGALWILEDEPAADDGPGALYRDLHACLARLVPHGRGDLLPLEGFLRTVPEPGAWTTGMERNREEAVELATLVGALRSVGERDAEAATLADRIDADGLDYGTYWWARWTERGS